MEPRFWPTFGQALHYLTDLGFVFDRSRPGFVIPRHPTEGSWFAFRDRSPETPAREVELLDMRAQLTGRGFVSDEEFARFWDQHTPRVLAPTQPTG